MMTRVVRWFLLTLSVFSCTTATEPITVSASVRQVTVWPLESGEVGEVDATLVLTIHNPTSSLIYLHPCGFVLDREEGTGQWREVWSPACILLPSANMPTEILPGSVEEIAVRVSASWNGMNWPSTGLGGTYRLRVWVSRDLPYYIRKVMDGVLPLTTNDFALSDR
jgi:hypothetical protein